MNVKKAYPDRGGKAGGRSPRGKGMGSDFSDLKHHLRETRIHRFIGREVG